MTTHGTIASAFTTPNFTTESYTLSRIEATIPIAGVTRAITIRHIGDGQVAVTDPDDNLLLIFPAWQRTDQWSNEFREYLIISVLSGTDMPKLYTAEYDGDIFVLDGGHRLRTIASFKANKFPIKVQHPEDPSKSQFVYYDNIQRRASGRSNAARVLTTQERVIFDNYPVSIVHYPASTELEARHLFNILNHHRAMTSAEVVNSIGTFLVEFLRDECYAIMDTGVTVRDALHNMSGSSFKKVDHHQDLLSLLSIWNVVNPEGIDDSEREENSVSKCKTTLASGVSTFVRNLDRPLEDFERLRFREMLDNMIHIDSVFAEHKLSAAYLLSALHFLRFNNASVDDFIDIMDTFNTDRRLWQRLFKEKDDENRRRRPNQDRLQLVTTQMNELDPYFWFTKYQKSQKSGGLDRNGMNVRKRIFEQIQDDFNGVAMENWRHVDAQQQQADA